MWPYWIVPMPAGEMSTSSPQKWGIKDMTIARNLACFLALASLASPALADVRTAAYAGASDQARVQTAMFAGATVRIGLNRKSGEPRYRTSLAVSGIAHDSAASAIQVGQGLELSLAGKGKPALLIGGSDAGELWRTAQMSGGGKAALIAGGVVAVLGVAALVAYESLPCQDGDDPCD